MPGVALVVIVLGLISAYQALFLDAPYPVPITDFGRDLLGARAAQLGVNPYQTVGELASAVPNWTVQPDAESFWVAHSPLSIALARGWLAVIGPEQAEAYAEIVQGLSLVILLGWLWVFFERGWSRWHGLLIVGAAAMTIGFRSDAFWIQGASFLAVGIALVLVLERSGRRNIALLLLGVLVAWRPWVAPMALVLPNSHSSLKDGVQVALTATIATLLVLPWTGGWESLSAWLFSALPANLDYYSIYVWNLSLTGPALPVALASVLYLASAALLPSQRKHWPRETWPLVGAVVVLAFTPLVWPQYWLALTVVLLLLAKARTFQWAALVLLVMAWPVAEHSAVIARMTSYLGVLILLVSLAGRRISGDDQGSRIPESPAGHHG